MTAPISIVLPTHNRAYVLWRAIQSVQSQTFRHWELLVVDDGSTDCTARLIEELREPRLRYMRIPRAGPSHARNRGVAESRFDLIAYIDSDNTWRPGYLESMSAAIGRHGGAIWYCGQSTTYWERTSAGRWNKIDAEVIARDRYDPEQALNLRGPDTNCMIHTKESWHQVGGWDEWCFWLEDWDFFTRVLLAYPSGAHWVDEILVDYRQVYGTGADGICGEAREDRRREIAGRRYLLEKWGDRLGPKARRRLSYREDELPLMRAGLWSCAG